METVRTEHTHVFVSAVFIVGGIRSGATTTAAAAWQIYMLRRRLECFSPMLLVLCGGSSISSLLRVTAVDFVQLFIRTRLHHIRWNFNYAETYENRMEMEMEKLDDWNFSITPRDPMRTKWHGLTSKSEQWLFDSSEKLTETREVSAIPSGFFFSHFMTNSFSRAMEYYCALKWNSFQHLASFRRAR